MQCMSNLWQLAYHLGGLTMLSPTPLEQLGTLPVPLRTAALKLAQAASPGDFKLETGQTSLFYSDGEYEWVRRWSVTSDALHRHLFSGNTEGPRATYSSVDEFCRRHELLAVAGKQDEHYAERLFLNEAFVPAFGLAGLTYLTPQAPLLDSEGRQRRIDFLLDTGNRYALEVEGRAYHSSREQDSDRFDDEKARQRELLRAGYGYMPFSFNDIRSGRAEAVLGDLAVEDPVLFRLMRGRLDEAGGPSADSSDLHRLDYLLRRLPREFPALQRAALAMLFGTHRSSRRTLTVVDFEPDGPALPIALLDALSLLERVGELYACSAALPKVRVLAVRPKDPKLYRELLGRYALFNPEFPDAPRTSFSLEEHDELPARPAPHHVIASSAERHTPAGAVLPAGLERLSAPMMAEVGSPPQGDRHPVNVERHLLDFFARRYFTLPELKPAQVQLVQRVLLGQSGLGILPTGFGKSLVFQLYALMVPQTTLVISPLKALIRDQVHSMGRLGLSCVESITGGDSSALKDRKLADFRARKHRLLYISPERLQIKSFAEELRASLETTPVGAIVVDEAHCVSEWGHDFRPAYLQIGHLRALLAGGSGRTVPLLAMTATASELVRKDICTVLELSRDSVVQLSSSDRPNLSLSVHPVPSQGKPDLLEELLRKTLPRVLKMSPSDLVPHGKEPPFQHAGVVFAVYANPHGRGTLPEGVHAIAKTLYDRVTFDESLVRVHASTAPSVCPHCKSPLWVPMSKAEQRAADVADTRAKRCLECGEDFVRPDYVSDWDSAIATNQDDFQDNAFPLLVATKGYGMGIDKRNLRFIVHHALSSGLEGYYQEAGRAGRDGHHSHAALVYAPPTSACFEHLRRSNEPPCVTEKRNFMFHRCPYGLETLCDYGKQARFIHSSYAGVEEDVEDVLKVLDQLTASAPIVTDERSNEDENKDTQLALYRLQQLGIVRGYSLKYKSLTKVEFGVEFNPDWTTESVAERLKELLMKFEYSQEQAESRIAALQPKLLKPERRRSASKEAVRRTEFLANSVTSLMERIYQTVPFMRYQMLKNELDYATSQECRRLVIRSRFDDAAFVPKDGYQCGFCDVCVPSLDFVRQGAAIPAPDAQVEEIARLLPDLMDAFDRADLTTVVQTAVSRGAVSGMYSRVVSRLESDATNLAALYLSGSLARRRPGRQQEAMQFLRRGFQEGTVQGAELPDLLSFSQEASQVDAQEGFHLLTPTQGPFNSQEGLALVQTEAEKLFGAEAPETRTVYAVRKTQRLAKAADIVVDTLKDSVDDLLRGFDELDDLLRAAS